MFPLVYLDRETHPVLISTCFTNPSSFVLGTACLHGLEDIGSNRLFLSFLVLCGRLYLLSISFSLVVCDWHVPHLWRHLTVRLSLYSAPATFSRLRHCNLRFHNNSNSNMSICTELSYVWCVHITVVNRQLSAQGLANVFPRNGHVNFNFTPNWLQQI